MDEGFAPQGPLERAEGSERPDPRARAVLSVLCGAVLVVASLGVFAVASVLLMAEKSRGIGVYDPAVGGDPLASMVFAPKVVLGAVGMNLLGIALVASGAWQLGRAAGWGR